MCYTLYLLANIEQIPGDLEYHERLQRAKDESGDSKERIHQSCMVLLKGFLRKFRRFNAVLLPTCEHCFSVLRRNWKPRFLWEFNHG